MNATNASASVASQFGRALTAVAIVLSAGKAALALNPESPQVRRLIDAGFEVLETANDPRLGGKCLIGLTFVKDDRPDHPQVAAAVEACRKAKEANEPGDVYSNGLALIFLCELDAKRHKGLINFFSNALRRRQKDHGGWGYDAKPSGDTSQTQYGTLALWEAHRNRVGVEASSVNRCLDWVLKTQDPSGAWGYQGKIGSPDRRIEQKEVRPSMVVAGLSSLLVCADLFGLLKPGAADVGDSPNGLPTGFREAKDEKTKPKVRPLSASGVNKSEVYASLRDGQSWMDKNFTISTERWNVYYLYSLERYKSFEELLVAAPEEEPEWYDKGFEHLSATREENGGWRLDSFDDHGVGTSFALLFLMRSTQKTLRRGLGDGVMISGRGAPVALARKKGLNPGGLLLKQASAQVTDMLALLDDGRAEQLDAIAADPTAFVGGPVDEKTGRRLQQLVRGGEPAARLLAVRALGQSGNLDYAPTLLFAFTDPDRRVTLAARDGLRFLSRRFEGYGLPDDFTKDQRFEALDRWKRWYLSFRPNAVLDL